MPEHTETEGTTPETPKVVNTQPDLILTVDGFPFKTQQAANRIVQEKNLGGRYEVLPYKGGYAVCRIGLRPPETLGANGHAADIRDDKYKYIEVLPSQYRVCPKCGRKVLKNDVDDGAPCDNPKGCNGFFGDDNTNVREHYFWVVFSHKQHDYEEDQVKLICQGDVIVVERGKEVCLAGRFLEAARHGLNPRWKKDPGKALKLYAPVMTFPFTELREGTEQEFRTQLASGTKKTQDDVAKYGDGRPE